MTQNDYPTGRTSGMSFISNRWVFTGSQGFRVVRRGALFDVVRYDASSQHVVYRGSGLSEDAAHALAARLAESED